MSNAVFDDLRTLTTPWRGQRSPTIGGGAGDAIAIGGGIAGLIGLYQYLQ